MNRTLRRKIEKQVRRLMLEDRCSLCKRPLEHNDLTYGGVTHDDKSALAGACCMERMASILTIGLFVNSGEAADALRAANVTGTGRSCSTEQAIEAVMRCRTAFAKLDKFKAEFARGSGVDLDRTRMNFEESPWKAADAAWFKAHPDRAHRVREIFPDEVFPVDPDAPVPADVSTMPIERVTVRQIAQGKRVRSRLRFEGARSDADFIAMISDMFERAEREEAVAHALFDLSAAKDGGPIMTCDVIALIRRYENHGTKQ